MESRDWSHNAGVTVFLPTKKKKSKLPTEISLHQNKGAVYFAHMIVPFHLYSHRTFKRVSLTMLRSLAPCSAATLGNSVRRFVTAHLSPSNRLLVAVITDQM